MPGERSGPGACLYGPLFGDGTLVGASESLLLGRFVADGDGQAFGALVARHGPMVLGVCRRLLDDPRDVEDAFQATFLVLIRKAGSLRDRDLLANWLYGVAYRVARRARATAHRRRLRERPAGEETAVTDRPGEDRFELRGVLDDELARLPGPLRAAVVLCDLEGLPQEAAASRLGCAVGTIKSRLSRARAKLRGRLLRRGVIPLAGAAGAIVAPEATATVPEALAAATIRLATQPTASASATALVEGIMRELTMMKIGTTAPIFLALILAAGTLALASRRSQEEPPKAIPPVTKQAPATKPAPPPPGTSPITITGRALGADGRPIPGARVYLASLAGRYGRVAETKAGDDGRYEFRNTPLPIQKADDWNKQDRGTFQVFGQAEGFGFAWQPERGISTAPGAINRFDLNLTFPPPAKLAGRITDDRGRPIAGARLEIRGAESFGFLKIDGRDVIGVDFNSLNGPDIVPAAIKVRTSDAEGRFAFDGLPPEYYFRIDIRAKSYPDRWIFAATSDAPPPKSGWPPALTGELALTLATPREVPVRVTFGGTGRPAAKVAIGVGGPGGVSDLETTDAEGVATLRLPPATYRLELLPAYGTPYLVTEGELIVTDDALAAPIGKTLDPAAVVEVTVVDAETGEGLPAVDLWQEVGGARERIYSRSWDVATRIVHADRPRTDARGKLRALLKPGTHVIGVGLESAPGGYEAVEPKGKEVRCSPGQTIGLRFTMRKRR